MGVGSALEKPDLLLTLLKDEVSARGMTICPSGIKRDISNRAKKLGIREQEMAVVAKEVIDHLCKQAKAELDKIIQQNN